MRPPEGEHRRTLSQRWLVGCTMVISVLLQLSPAAAQDVSDEAFETPLLEQRLPLTRPVLESLSQLQDRWLLANSALLQGDVSLASSAIEELSNNLRALGFETAPELSLALAVRGLEAARQSEDETADLSFSLAEQLDPGLPALAIGRARAEWLRGNGLAGARWLMTGYWKAMSNRHMRSLAIRNVAIWLLLTLLVASLAFIALQFATKGGLLLKDLRSLIPGPALFAGIASVVLLLLPFFLPSPWLWVGFVWSVLLWSYVSQSERWVLAVCVLALGVAPTGFELLSLDTAISTTSEARLLEDLDDRVFRGRTLIELAELHEALPEDVPLSELMADVHQGLGQDDVARPLYRLVADAEPLNGAALNNLGVFHSRRRERVAAIDFLQSAAELDESAAAAAYNLSRLYDQLLEFGNSQRYLRQAREASADDVEGWEQDRQLAVSLQGGFERIPEVRSQLTEWHWTRSRLYEASQPLVLAIAVLLLAIVLRWLGFGSRGGWRDAEVSQANWLGDWARHLLPGLQSAEAGDGGRAFIGVLLPIGIGLWLAATAFGYPIPWGLEPGPVPIYLATTLALVAFFTVRAISR